MFPLASWRRSCWAGSFRYTVSARTVIKIGFLMVVVGDAIWLTPHGFVPTGAKLVAELELPSDWNFLALMPAKNFCGVYVGVRHGRQLRHL